MSSRKRSIRSQKGTERKQRTSSEKKQSGRTKNTKKQGQEQEEDLFAAEKQNTTYYDPREATRARQNYLRGLSREEKYAQYIRSPIIGHTPKNKFERELEQTYGDFCRQAVHIGGTSADRIITPGLDRKDEERKSHIVPYAVRSLDENKRFSQLRERFPNAPSRPDCGSHYRFEGFDTAELYWYYNEKARTQLYRDFFKQFPRVTPPPWRNQKEEMAAREQMIDSLNQWQESKEEFSKRPGAGRGIGGKLSNTAQSEMRGEEKEERKSQSSSSRRNSRSSGGRTQKTTTSTSSQKGRKKSSGGNKGKSSSTTKSSSSTLRRSGRTIRTPARFNE